MTIEQYVQQLCSHCGLTEEDFSVTTVQDGERLRVSLELSEEYKSIFIGTRGETLDAIELVLRLVFQEEFAQQKIVFDIGDYRQQKEQRLQEKALSVAEKVLESGRSYSFGYLNSYERYLIHHAVSQDMRFNDLETISEDTDRGRVLVMRIKNEGYPDSE